MKKFLSLLLSICSLIVFAAALSAAEPAKSVRFVRKQLDSKFRSEGVAVADFNKDGKMDIAAGWCWYEAPDWKMHNIAEKAQDVDPHGYSNAFCCFAEDVNHDGWSDLLVVDFPGQPTWWFENPKETGKVWPKHTVTPVTNNESPTYLDLNGDGKKELICAVSLDPKMPDGPDRVMAYLTPKEDPNAEWTIHAISAKGAPGTARYAHGLGVGDVNKDGKNDIVVGDGWWEAPAKDDGSEWKWHAAKLGGQGAQMYVYDFDGDGDNDVFSSSPHAFGMWWHEQTGKDQWTSHEIDKTFSQIHGVCFADMNGDGLPDIVCGKRFWAHAPKPDGTGGDPGVNEPARLDFERGCIKLLQVLRHAIDLFQAAVVVLEVVHHDLVPQIERLQVVDHVRIHDRELAGQVRFHVQVLISRLDRLRGVGDVRDRCGRRNRHHVTVAHAFGFDAFAHAVPVECLRAIDVDKFFTALLHQNINRIDRQYAATPQ